MTAPQMCACRGHTFLSLCPLDEVRHVGHHRLVRPPEIGSGTTSSTPNKTDTPSRSGKPRSRRRVRWENIWVKEAFAIAVIIVALVSLQISDEGYLRRNGVRVTATVTELPSGDNDCGRCPLAFTIDGEQYHAKEDLRMSSEGQGTNVIGDTVDLYVDPNDKTHVVDVVEVESHKTSVIFVTVFAALFAIALPPRAKLATVFGIADAQSQSVNHFAAEGPDQGDSSRGRSRAERRRAQTLPVCALYASTSGRASCAPAVCGRRRR